MRIRAPETLVVQLAGLLVIAASCFPCQPVDAEETIVAFGDSTTAPRAELRVYASLIQQELTASGRHVRVVNAGVGGHDTVLARNRFDRDVLSHKPDIAIIQFGINDAAVDVWKNPAATAPRVKPEQYEANLRHFAETLASQGARVVLMTPNPLRWTPKLKSLYGKAPYQPEQEDGFNVLLRQYAEIVRRLAAQQKTPLVDVFAAFEEHGRDGDQSVDDLLIDGMHPNRRGHRLVADLLVKALSTPPQRSQPSLVEVKRIWDKAPHNAFTDLLRHKDRWYCVFREGRAHVSPDGALRVLTSKDGDHWESAALLASPTYDLRDAKITVAPNGQLMLNGAGMIADARIRYQSMTWFSSDDGFHWDQGHHVGDPGFWLWRVHWRGKTAYSMGYSTFRNRTDRSLRLYQSADGRKFQTLVPKLTAPAGCGEDKILFLADGSALCLLRHETGDKMAQLGSSQAPYTNWQWRDMNMRIGGPDMIQLPDGRILAVTRLYDGGARTSLSWLDPQQATLTETLRLPSGGDTSYAGLVWHEGLLWISYYSSHEGKASIYLAKVKIPQAS